MHYYFIDFFNTPKQVHVHIGNKRRSYNLQQIIEEKLQVFCLCAIRIRFILIYTSFDLIEKEKQIA